MEPHSHFPNSVCRTSRLRRRGILRIVFAINPCMIFCRSSKQMLASCYPALSPRLADKSPAQKAQFFRCNTHIANFLTPRNASSPQQSSARRGAPHKVGRSCWKISSSAAWSRMSAFPSRPVVRLSTARRLCRSLSSASTMCESMNPAPPVTTIVMAFNPGSKTHKCS